MANVPATNLLNELTNTQTAKTGYLSPSKPELNWESIPIFSSILYDNY